MWNLKRNYKNELNKKRPTDLENKLMVAGAKDQGKRQGVWRGHVHIAIFKMDSQQEPTV